MQLSGWASLFLVATTVGGCVTSETPLFSERDAIADASLLGSYTMFDSDKKSSDVEIFLKDKEYVAANKEKHKNSLMFIAMLYGFQDSSLIVEARVPKDIHYYYLVLSRSSTGFTASLIPCPIVNGTATCTPSNKDLVIGAARSALGHFDPKDTLTFEKRQNTTN